MPQLQNDQDYLNAGVAPPEHIPHQGSDSVPIDYHRHEWQVQGNWLHCERGSHPHGIPYNHMKHIFNGTGANGEPLYQTIDLANERKDDINNGASRP